jgi:CheY-like chemotaxis protein
MTDSDLEGLLEARSVLVVDDDADSRELLTEIFRMSGATVLVARTAPQALAVLRHAWPDAIVTDVAMPEGDGYWLLAEIRRLCAAARRSVPLVAVTGYHRDHTRRRALAAGFDGYVTKPVDFVELCRTVAALTQRAA